MPKSLEIGDKIPDLSLKNERGDLTSLHDHLGQPLVLFFYPKDGSPVCTAEACSFRDRFSEFRDLKATVFGISSDSPEKHKQFIEKHNLPFSLLSDSKGKARSAFGVPASMGILPGRVTYVIDADGNIRHKINSQLNAQKHIREALSSLSPS